MASSDSDYYVYVYIDPRNFEEFYYGKGRGSRKEAHLFDSGDSPKTKRIAEIRAVGVAPIVRVIARGLTESQALLIEATLLWRLGRFTTNIARGHFTELFRPLNSLHRDLPGFDFLNRLYYFNVGEGKGERRLWDDCRKYSFIAAGHGPTWRDAICQFKPGDVFAAYLKGSGFVGIGRIKASARMAREVVIEGKPLLKLCPIMDQDADSPELSEYAALVDWIRAVPRQEAKMKRKAGLYTTPLLRASLDGQPRTVDFLTKEFAVDFPTLLT